jgi:hypothetical protein
MSRLNVNPYDHNIFVRDVTEMLEEVLSRPISELEDPSKLIADARLTIRLMREALSVAKQPLTT